MHAVTCSNCRMYRVHTVSTPCSKMNSAFPSDGDTGLKSPGPWLDLGKTKGGGLWEHYTLTLLILN